MLNRPSKKIKDGSEGCVELRARALRLLARREHTRRELTEKLNPHAAETFHIETVLDELVEEGLLSDTRAAQAILNSRVGRQGSLKIRQALQKHGVPNDLLAQTMQSARAGELKAARSVWGKKFNERPINADERARQGRYLQNRGFSPAIIRQVLQSDAESDD
jgi:regulatory protein